jgi:hypothetical protein
MTDPNPFMEALEDITPIVEMLTGLKRKFIAAGWSADNAESAALEVYKTATRQAAQQ